MSKINDLIERVNRHRVLTAHLIIRACPFCNSAAGVYRILNTWSVTCHNHQCNASGPIRATPAAAVNQWNARVSETGT